MAYLCRENGAIKIPGIEDLDLITSTLSPAVPVRQWGVKGECNDADREENRYPAPANSWSIPEAKGRDAVCCEIVYLAQSYDRKIQGWEIVV